MTDVPIYLDHQATTPMDERAVAAMLPYFAGIFGNPHANHHSFGSAAEQAISAAREQIATLVGAQPNEIVFTSGATEANNLAIRGAAEALRKKGKSHIVTSSVEHSCILAITDYLQKSGFEVTRLAVEGDGRVLIRSVEDALRPETGLVSIMAANNEIGTLQPVAEIGALCAQLGVLFHTDAAQAAGKVPVDVRALSVDLMSLSAHKMYGPKGIGALYVRKRVRESIEPVIIGGGQEAGMRGGTLPTPLCVGFGEAARIAAAELHDEAARIADLRNRFLERIEDTGVSFLINGSMTHRLPGNLSLSFLGVDAEALLMSLRERVAISTGSACTTGRLEPSHVLQAIGLSNEAAESSVRIGFGRFTSEEEVDRAAGIIASAILRLSRLSRSTRADPYV